MPWKIEEVYTAEKIWYNLRMKTKRKHRNGIKPLYIVIALAVLLLAIYAVAHKRHCESEIVNDPHYGMVEVFNGEGYVWVVPEEDVPKNTLVKEDFVADPEGEPSYVGGEYRTSRGIDVSAYQGDIDWQAVYDDGVRFAIIRAGGRYYGSGELYSDDKFIENVERAQAAGLQTGVYFFSQAISAEEAREEARYVLELIGSRQLQLPVFFDWEQVEDTNVRTEGLSGETLTDCAVAFCEEIKSAGYDAGVYVYNATGYYGYDLSRLTDYMFWCASVGNYPYFYYAHTVWQYSFSGSVAGIGGECDMNMMFIK